MTISIDGTNGISGVDGSAATPALQGTDTNTGISFGTDEVNIVTGGSTRATVDSSGNVGIGTTSPSEVLDVNGAVKAGGNTSGVALLLPNANCAIRDAGASGSSLYFDVATGGATHGAFVFRSSNAYTERMRITNGTSGGLILVGRSTSVSANATLGIDTASGVAGIVSETGPTSAIDHIRFYNGNGNVGNITTNGGATAYNTSSDYRLKENIVDIADGITRVKQLQPRRFNFITDDTTTVDGFIAHEAQAVVPEAITGEKDAVDDDGNPVYQGIDQSKLVPLLTAALQEAVAKIEQLETRVAQLEGGAS